MIKNAFLSEDESKQIACGKTQNVTLEGVSLRTCFPSQTARRNSTYSTFEDVDDSIYEVLVQHDNFISSYSDCRKLSQSAGLSCDDLHDQNR